MTRLTDEQLSELIAYQQGLDDTYTDYSDVVTCLQELQALRAKPIALVPSEEDLFSWSNEFKKLGGQWPNHGATYDWLRSRIKPITSDQWKQIREAWEQAQQQWYAHASGLMDFDGSPEEELYEENLKAFKILDEIEGKK